METSINNKCKAFTSLEQSKKLAEILPIESADMVLLHEEPYETSDSKFDGLHQALCVPFNKYGKLWRQKYKNISYFPCWSLAALLDVLPRFIEYKGNKYYLRFMKEYVEYANDEISITGRCLHTTGNDNPIDACVEMIIKLNERKML